MALETLPPLILTEHPRHAVAREGRRDFHAGRPLEDNPYPSLVSQWAWWRAGWIEAHLDVVEAEQESAK